MLHAVLTNEKVAGDQNQDVISGARTGFDNLLDVVLKATLNKLSHTK